MKVYERVYDYYLDKMLEGELKSGEKMPSLRECEKTLGVSRTSVETAYQQLADDGYIYSVEKVGYYVSKLASNQSQAKELSNTQDTTDKKEYIYDLATIGEDKQVSCLQLWRRYMKSALRQEDRLLSYADNQGEEDLREEIAKYVRKTRNIICTPEDVVVGAGFQILLQVLIALIPGEKTISFPTKDFADGATTFKNAGFEINYRDKESHVIYVTPSYMTKWGEVMTMKRRRELVDHALTNNHLIIEDDYQNDFVFSQKPTPSLYALTGGENTAFLGSFSRVLLPSVRISYLILPKGTKEEYKAIRNMYNQTASKAEQIALTQFLRDGHLNRHVKKMRRLYEEKRKLLEEALKDAFESQAKVLVGDSGMEMALELDTGKTLVKWEELPVKVSLLKQEQTTATILISCSKIASEDIKLAVNQLKAAYKEGE